MTQQSAYDIVDQQFDQYVEGTYDTSFVMNGYNGGCSEGYFGQDPLSQSKAYQCPKFVNVQYVDSYVREDGTFVKGHWRSNPDSVTWNNLNVGK